MLAHSLLFIVDTKTKGAGRKRKSVQRDPSPRRQKKSSPVNELSGNPPSENTFPTGESLVMLYLTTELRTYSLEMGK